jgi:putative tryptophan/tyrosine transport system substrate-binding protein
MRRRDLLAYLGALTVLRTSVGMAQQPNVRIGLLGVPPPSDPIVAPLWGAFVEALQEKGWVEGHNLLFDRRWSQARPQGYFELADALVVTRPDMIIALSSQAVRAARQVTDKVPIVAIGLSDLVALGLVASLARPGGNVTGFGVEQGTLTVKALQIFQEARPGLSRVALFYTPANPASNVEAEKAIAFAPRLGITIEPHAVNVPEDLDAAFAMVTRTRPDGMMLHGTPILFSNDRRIAGFALEHLIPAIGSLAGSVQNGLFLSYAPDQIDMWVRAAGVVDKILRGESPADIPVELPTKFHFAINLKTAKALGMTVPLSLLARADEVIE